MDISATVFNNLRDLLVVEGGQVPTIIAPKTNNKEYPRFLLVRNEAVEADKKPEQSMQQFSHNVVDKIPGWYWEYLVEDPQYKHQALEKVSIRGS